MYVNITLTKTCIAYPRHLFFDSSPGISRYFPVFTGISGFLLESALNEVTKNPKRRFLLASGYLRAFVGNTRKSCMCKPLGAKYPSFRIFPPSPPFLHAIFCAHIITT